MSALRVEGDLATVTIDNRRAANALDDATRKAVLEALRSATDDPACAAIVLTGAGDTFCGGGDLASMPTEGRLVRRRLGEMHDLVRLIRLGPKPVVAAVDGNAFGSGLSLAAACDHVVATRRAHFGCTFGAVGLVADCGLVWTLPRRVGWRHAHRILLVGARMEAEEAHDIGLVDDLVEPPDLLVAARRWAAPFAERAPLAVAATKRLLSAASATLDDLLDRELQLQAGLLASDDFAEGRAAFFARRPPAFRRGGRERPSRGESHVPAAGPLPDARTSAEDRQTPGPAQW